MKIQHLAIIFVLIILPIDIVLGLYLDAQINTLRNQSLYDSRLVGCVYDALEVYQANSIVDTENDIVTSKMNNIEASASTFLTSLQTAFGYSGYKATVMQEYVPAVVYTMYDGYYIYSKFNNTLSETSVYKDSTYNDGSTIEGLKSYVFYSCRYNRRTNNGKEDDFVITYTLDNYITIQGTIQGKYVNESGYLIDGITKNGDKYIYDDVEFTSSDSSNMKEYVGPYEYPYAKINGTKYYYDDNGTLDDNEDDKIFHIINGTRVNYPPYSSETNSEYKKYSDAINKNKSAYLYYKEAFEFTNKVRSTFNCVQEVKKDIYGNEVKDKDGNFIMVDKFTGLGLNDLKSNNAVYFNAESGNLEQINDFGSYYIFKPKSGKFIQDSDSDFNQHRAAVIRYTVETNLKAAIAGFSNMSTQDIEFAMPKISEENWEIIENNVCVIGFLQGLDIGTKKYNGYAVCANTTTNEYVDPSSIYIAVEDDGGGVYHRANSTDLYTIDSSKIKSNSGVYKMDFERHYLKVLKGDANLDGVVDSTDTSLVEGYTGEPTDVIKKYLDLTGDGAIDGDDADYIKNIINGSMSQSGEITLYYYPKSKTAIDIYSASYSSVIMQTAVNTDFADMYKYMRYLDTTQHNSNNASDKAIKKAYYTALARERYGSYKMSHDKEYSYFLKNY